MKDYYNTESHYFEVEIDGVVYGQIYHTFKEENEKLWETSQTAKE
jgi:hypothetical protein